MWTLPFSALAALTYALPALVPRRLSDVHARRLLWLAWALHAISLLVLLMGPVRFGFAPALSVTAWLVVTAYMIEKFGELVGAFAGTMELFPVSHVSVISGQNRQDGPISAIHPSAKDAEINRRIGEILGGVGAVSAATPQVFITLGTASVATTATIAPITR